MLYLKPVANVSQSLRGIFFSCETCKNDYDLCFKCFRSKAILHPAHTMEQHGSEEIIHSSPEVPNSEKESATGSPVASEDSDDEIIDLETVVATVQGSRAD